MEAKLRKAGIKILTQEECYKTPGEPYLYLNININAGKLGDDKYSYRALGAVLATTQFERFETQDGFIGIALRDATDSARSERPTN